MSLYWAAGGQVGRKTIGVEIYRLGRECDPSLVAQLWTAFALKALIAMLALALVQPWGRRLRTISTPEAVGTYAVPWHLALWDPFWLVGGLLFLAATRAFQKSPLSCLSNSRRSVYSVSSGHRLRCRAAARPEGSRLPVRHPPPHTRNAWKE